MLPDATVRYAEHADAVIDLHLPPASGPVVARALDRPGPPRVVVLLHGGFWRQEWDRRHTRSLARALAERGLVVATPEYRRVGGGGGWPVTGNDVERAVRRLPQLLGGLGVSVGALSVAGHSAGGQLALWLATRLDGSLHPSPHPASDWSPGPPSSHSPADDGPVIDRVVALAPVCDLAEASRLRLGDDAVRAMLGGSQMSEADPRVLLEHRPSATVAVLHGRQDEVVPVSLSRGLASTFAWVRLHEVPGDHFAVVVDSGPVFELLLHELNG